jgi:hypothetical protein
MSIFALSKASQDERTSSLILPHQKNKAEQMPDDVSQETASQKCRMCCVCCRINSTCCSLQARISNNIRWMVARAKEIKVKEIPYFLSHPSLIISLLYRQRVKDAIANLQPRRIITALSMIEPSHAIEGNLHAMIKCRARVLELNRHKAEFDSLLKQGAPISQQLADKLMKSTSPIQCVFDNGLKKYISFNGTGRLFSLKIFFLEEYSGRDPKIEITVYRVDPVLIKRAICR